MFIQSVRQYTDDLGTISQAISNSGIHNSHAWLGAIYSSCRLKSICKTSFTVFDTRIFRAVAHIFLDEIQAAIVGHKGSDLLAVLDELYSGAFSDS